MIDLLCLIELYNTYNHDDINFEISKKMLNDFNDIGSMDMNELADYLFVSNSTLYRFTKLLWYDNYLQMKIGQQMFLEQYMHNGKYVPNELNASAGLKEYGDSLTQRMNQFLHEVDDRSIDHIVEQMLLAENIVFAAIPMPSAIWRLQVELILLGKQTSAFINPRHQIEEVEAVNENDMVFMIQNSTDNGTFYIETAKSAKRKHATTIFISNIPISPTLKHADHSITFNGAMCEVDMILIEMILHVIGDKLNKKVIESKRK